MRIVDILDSVQYVVDSQGRQTAVQFDLTTWESLRPLFEELIEDGRLGQLMDEVADDERLEGDAALQAYQSYLSQA
jgi:hypothetical protein